MHQQVNWELQSLHDSDSATSVSAFVYCYFHWPLTLYIAPLLAFAYSWFLRFYTFSFQLPLSVFWVCINLLPLTSLSQNLTPAPKRDYLISSIVTRQFRNFSFTCLIVFDYPMSTDKATLWGTNQFIYNKIPQKEMWVWQISKYF